MSTPNPASRPGRPRSPLWVIEGIEITRVRKVPLRVVTGLLCAIGIVLAIALPDLVPPTPLVGAAVALAALLVGLAVAVAVDAADLTVRGPRHVRAAGGELVAILPTTPDPDEAIPLADAVLEAREGEEPRLLLGLAAAGRDTHRCAAWTDALAVALARTGASVLSVDLAKGRSERPGLVEVLREGRKLSTVVSFDPELRLARVGAGHDHDGALELLPTLPNRLPRDLDVLLVALPTAASRQVVAATRALDHVLVVAERDVTARVDLVAGLDALEAAGMTAQVALLDDRTAAILSAEEPGATDPRTADADADAAAELAAADAGPVDEASEPADTRVVAADEGSGPADEASEPADTRVVAADAGSGPVDEASEPADTRVVAADAGSEPAAIEPREEYSEVRVLTSAEAARRAQSLDPQPPSVGARDVEVVLQAAAADAAAQSEVSSEPLQPLAERRPRVSEGDPSHAERHDRRRGPRELDAPGAADAGDEGDATDPEELRSTAQVATLLDDLQDRDDRS